MNKIWIATIAVSILILAGAVFLGHQRQEQPQIPEAPPIAAASRSPEEPVALSMPPPSAGRQAESAASGGNVEKRTGGRPALALGHLAGTLKASLPVLTENERRLPLEYSCFRAQMSPPVKWEGSPRETKSFAIFMERREAGNPPFLTWALYDIPATYTHLERNVPKMPEPGEGMKHARADNGAVEYTGPCESRGNIPYTVRLFALDAVLPLPAGADIDDLIRAMNGHIVDMAEVNFIHYLRF